MLRQSLRKLSRPVLTRGLANEATFDLPECKLHRFDITLPTTVTLTRDDAFKYYKDMTMIRRMETSANALYKSKEIRGFLHLYSGQEAVCVGMEAAITPDDSIITAYRDHGWAYTRGVEPRAILAELTGRSGGCSKGKGGSMHMYTDTLFGGNGIVGAQVPIGAGIAFAHSYKENGKVCISLYGDGAANQGQIFEAFNLAALFKSPCMFTCENNHYGMGTSDVRAAANPHYYTRGDAVPGIKMDGMNVLAVREFTKAATDWMRAGNGPVVAEVETYRYYGHSMSDPGTSYRTRDEVQEVRKTKDPITQLKSFMLEGELATAAELKEIEAECRQVVDEGVEYSRSSPELEVHEMYNTIYQGMDGVRVRGADALTYGIHSP
ncbi:pyruvate dehydrogenase E1 component subunit alpha, mitochondrial-like [Bolinopsis microptera]|uniref:pyruvate dehydrogenase E1 component subunit alpha, mitochondrial-like n=1 Tax=Bolinopsis microptera TaxID=2820187 RepID=UPI0030790C27